MKKIGMLFPDYGSQYVGMAKELYDNSRVMQEYFEEASSCLNVNFIKLCFAASDIELSKIENAYTALFLTSGAIAAFLKERSVTPAVVAGYGIGEFTAIHAAGGLSLPDGLYLLNKYAQFFQEIVPTLNASIILVQGVPTAKLKKLCSLASDSVYQAYIAAYNGSAEHLVVGGHHRVTDLISSGVKEAGGSAYKDRIERGLHGKLMDPVVVQLKKYLTKVDFKDLKIPLVASVDGTTVEQGDLVKRRVMKQLQAPIRWDKVMEMLEPCDVILEIGPGTGLSRLVKQQYPEKKIYPINRLVDFQEVEDVLKSDSVDFNT